MNEAANEKRKLALERNEVINRVPHIAVMSNGS